jgi:hypothetical protein
MWSFILNASGLIGIAEIVWFFILLILTVLLNKVNIPTAVISVLQLTKKLSIVSVLSFWLQNSNYYKVSSISSTLVCFLILTVYLKVANNTSVSFKLSLPKSFRVLTIKGGNNFQNSITIISLLFFFLLLKLPEIANYHVNYLLIKTVQIKTGIAKVIISILSWIIFLMLFFNLIQMIPKLRRMNIKRLKRN